METPLQRMRSNGQAFKPGRRGDRYPEFAADTPNAFASRQTAAIIWRFEAPIAFHHFLSRPAYRRARRIHRLDLETKALAARRTLFFSSRRAGGAVVPPVR